MHRSAAGGSEVLGATIGEPSSPEFGPTQQINTDDDARQISRAALRDYRRIRAAHTRRLRPGTPRAGLTATPRASDSRHRRASGSRPVRVRGSRRSGASRASPSGDDDPSDDDADALARLIAGQADAFSFGFDQFHAAVERHRSDAPGPLRREAFDRLPMFMQRRAWRRLLADVETARWG